jgi:hypothetical protein
MAGSVVCVKIHPEVGTRGGLFDYFLAKQKVIQNIPLNTMQSTLTVG